MRLVRRSARAYRASTCRTRSCSSAPRAKRRWRYGLTHGSALGFAEGACRFEKMPAKRVGFAGYSFSSTASSSGGNSGHGPICPSFSIDMTTASIWPYSLSTFASLAE